MRTCLRCATKMEDNYYINDEGVRVSHLVAIKKNKDYTKESFPIEISVCPKCGYVEFYIEPKKAID